MNMYSQYVQILLIFGHVARVNQITERDLYDDQQNRISEVQVSSLRSAFRDSKRVQAWWCAF